MPLREDDRRKWQLRLDDVGISVDSEWGHVRLWREMQEAGEVLRFVVTYPHPLVGLVQADYSAPLSGEWPFAPSYVVEVLGDPSGWPATGPHLALSLPAQPPPPPGTVTFAIRAREETARYGDSPVYLRLQRDADGEQQWAVLADKGRPPPTLDQAAQALKAAPMLTKFTDAGRHVGFNIEPEEEVIRLLKDAVRTMRYEGIKFGIKELWKHLSWEKDAYYLRVNRYHIALGDVRRWYYESPTKSTPRARRD